MLVTRIYTGDDERSHFEELDLPLNVTDLGAMSAPIPTVSVFIRSTAEAGPEVYDFHVAPRRQFVVHVQGATEIEVADGDRRTLARAIEYLNGVNSEIEAVIRAQWPSKATPARPARPGSNA